MVQHLGSAAGAFTASRMLWQLPESRLGGMDRVAWLAATLAAVVPAMLWILEARVRRGEGAPGEPSRKTPRGPAAGPLPLAERVLAGEDGGDVGRALAGGAQEDL